jgi:hypothetical protein
MLDYVLLRQTMTRSEIKMNTFRLAVATTVVFTLCGAAGAETMSTAKSDPLAVPVSGHDDPAAKRAARPWTAERQANAQPKAAAQVDPAAVRAASERFRSGTANGPQGETAPVVLAAGDGGLIGAQSAPGSDGTLEYWTPERLRAAKPMELPQLNEEEFQQLLKAGKKNR